MGIWSQFQRVFTPASAPAQKKVGEVIFLQKTETDDSVHVRDSMTLEMREMKKDLKNSASDPNTSHGEKTSETGSVKSPSTSSMSSSHGSDETDLEIPKSSSSDVGYQSGGGASNKSSSPQKRLGNKSHRDVVKEDLLQKLQIQSAKIAKLEEENERACSQEQLYANTEIVRLKPVIVSTERVNQRLYEAIFNYEIPAKCLQNIKHVALRLIVHPGANHSFVTPYFLRIKYQFVYAWTGTVVPCASTAIQEEVDGFVTAACHVHSADEDSPTTLMFPLTPSLESIAKRIGTKDLRKKKSKMESLHLELAVRRRILINPTSRVENCDLAHLFRPAYLSVEWDAKKKKA